MFFLIGVFFIFLGGVLLGISFFYWIKYQYLKRYGKDKEYTKFLQDFDRFFKGGI